MVELLIFTLLLPLAGALMLLAVPKNNVSALKYLSLGVSLVTLVTAAILLLNFDSSSSAFQYYFNQTWIPSIDGGFRIGVDGISILLVALTAFLTPIMIMSSFSAIEKREKEYYFFVMLLEFAMIGVFISLDLILFYIFWELILIPMYFIIGIWGGKDKFYATVKFFIFTVVGSLFMLAAIVWVGIYAGDEAGFTTNYMAIRESLTQLPIPMDIQKWIFLAFALSFCIKVPLFPVHTWLPDAHTEAPTPGSVILAGVLLKMGTYGLIRFNLELFPQASAYYSQAIAALAVVGIIYGAMVAMVQTDIKKLVAYSSVSHMGFIVLGIFSVTTIGVQGAIIQMINHGLSTGMLFLCVGMIYERRHTREISEFGGIARVMPVFTVFFAIAMMASVGLPGLNGFIGEYLTLIGAFTSPVLDSWAFAIFSASGVIFAAVYLLWMFQRVMYGENTNPANHHLKDLNAREIGMLVPLVIFIVWIGVYPSSFLKISEASAKRTVEHVMQNKSVNNYSIQINNNK